MKGDASYFIRRAAEEKLAAGAATHSRSRKAHLELAARYEDIARDLAG
jgi:hypothetical protein